LKERQRKVMGRRERRCKQLLHHLKEKKGYWKFKEDKIAICEELALEEGMGLS
jgi:hypothetical protein